MYYFYVVRGRRGEGGERKGERIVVRLFPRAARYRSCEQRRDKSMYMCITLFRRYESRGRMRKGRNREVIKGKFDRNE